MTGRGTPRTPQQGESPGFFENINVPAQGAWGYSRTFGGSQVLTANYSAYTVAGEFQFEIPYGATRLSVIGLYTPAEAAGRLGLQVKWFTGVGLANVLLVRGGTPTVAPSADPEVVEIETYAPAVVTPAAAFPVTSPNRYVIPFEVPPLAFPEAVYNPTPDALSMRIYVREAAAGAAGTFALERIVAESFGEAQPVAQR
ncbi:MAG: hypothetical protein ACTS8S_14210 [Giesbergeria sp.]|jgi:hypothetical protein